MSNIVLWRTFIRRYIDFYPINLSFRYMLCNHVTPPRVDMQRYESAMSWRAHDGEVYSVEFSYDENTVFSIGEDGKVRLGV